MSILLRVIDRSQFAIAVGLLSMMLAGCKSGGVQIDGGKGLIGPRRVHVGETFDITQPFDVRTGAEWELIEFDSKIVQLTAFRPVDTSDVNSMVRIMRFVAKAPGETDLVFAKRNREPHQSALPPEPRERKTITVRVVE
jgi:hypothetical protein